MATRDKFSCQSCSSRSMIRVEDKDKGMYILKCEKCGAEIGPLPLKGIKDKLS